MNKKRLTVFNLILFLILTVFLSGCSKKKDEHAIALENALRNSRNYIYKENEVDFKTRNGRTFDQLQVTSNFNKTLAVGVSVDFETQSSQMYVSELKSDGSIENMFNTSMKADITRACLGFDDKLYILTSKYEEETGTLFVLQRYSLSGNLDYEIPISSLISEKNILEEQLYFNGMLCANDKVYFTSNCGFITFDSNGNYLDMVPTNNLDSQIRNCYGIFCDYDQQLYTIGGFAGGYGSDRAYNVQCTKIDNDNFSVMDVFPLDSNATSNFGIGPGNQVLLSTFDGIYSFDINSGECKKRMDYVASYISTSAFDAIQPISPSAFFASYHDDSDGTFKFSYFTKVRPEDVVEKQEISIGMLYPDFAVKRHVIEFNKSSLQYKINIVDYSSLYGNYDGDVIKQISKDAASGNMPDILLMDSSFPVDVYINKGLLTDFTPFLENDPDYSIDDMLPNVVSAYSVDGKMYQLVPCFTVPVLMVKASDVDNAKSWTIYNALDLWERRGLDKYFVTTYSRGEFLDAILSCTRDSYINWDNGTCDFENDSFYKVLEFLKKIPEKAPQVNWEDLAAQYRDGSTIAATLTLYDYTDVNRFQGGYYGEKVSLIGFPSIRGNGSVIKPQYAFAVYSKSEAKEGCWEFLRYFLSKDFWDSPSLYTIPNNMEGLLAIEKKGTERPYYEEWDGTKYYYDISININGQELNLDPMSQEEAKEVTDYILSIDEPYRIDKAVSAIVSEETAAYFSGQKSAEQVAKIIQSRVSLYLAESR